jgi:hypothetical protein
MKRRGRPCGTCGKPNHKRFGETCNACCLRAARERAAKAHTCTQCRVRPARPGMATCGVCIDYRVALRREKPTSGLSWCMECIAFGFHRYGCTKTKARAA